MKFIDGFAIDYKQDSTAGHGLWLRNVGIEVVNDDGDTWRWGSYNRARQNDYSTHTAKYTFNEADKAYLSNNNGRFKQFICRVSSRGGTGTRTTNLTLGDFRLLYSDTGCETGRWIIPGKRGYSQRTSQDIVVIRCLKNASCCICLRAFLHSKQGRSGLVCIGVLITVA